MSKFINKVVTGVATTAMAVSMLVLPVAATNVHAASAGEVYKTSDGTVWFITKDMKRRPFTSAGAFMSYGFLSFSQVKDADSSVTSLPTGDFIAPQDGRIFCATETKASDVKGECSLITGGQKAAFTSASVFGGQGYSFGRAFYGDSSFLSKTSNIDNASAQHRNGTLVNNGGTVQLVVTGGLWGVPSMDVFNSWGWSFADVVPANAADKSLSQVGVIPARMAGDLVPTGVSGNTNGGGTLNGGAGDAVLTETSADVQDTVNEGDNNTKVDAFKVEATGSDIQLTSVKVSLEEQGAGGSQKLDRYATTVSVYEGSTKVGSMDVSDFTKTGVTYTASIPLTNAIVREGSANKQTFYIAVSALNTIDSGNLGSGNNIWEVTPSQVRFIDGTGVTLTADTGSLTSTDFSFDSLASSGDVKFRAQLASDNPIAGNVEVSDTASTSNVTLLKFKLCATGSDITFDQITFTETGTGATPVEASSELALKNGTSTIQTWTPRASNGNDTINLDSNEVVSAGDCNNYSVVAKINKIDVGNFGQGDSLKVSLVDTNATDQNDDAVTMTGSAVGETQTFYSTGAAVTFVSDAYTAEDQSIPTDGTISLTFKVTAFGDNDVTMSESQGTTENAAAGNNVVSFNVSGTSTITGSHITCNGKTASGGIITVFAGETSTCTLAVKFNTASGFVQLTINSVDGTTVSNIKTAAF